MSSDIIGKYSNNRMYVDNSTLRSNCLFRYTNNKVYAGDSYMNSDIILNTSSYVHPIIIFVIICLM